MKTKTLLLAFLLSVTLFSCKKNKDVKKKPNCHIITLNSSGGDVINLTYNADGKVQKIITNGYTATTISYSGNTAIATTLSNGTFLDKEIITLNNDGLAANVKTEINSSGTIWYNDAINTMEHS